MAYTSKSELKKALKSSGASWSQRGGQTAKNILKEAPGHKMSAYETEKFLKERGMSDTGVKKVMKTLEQPAQPKQEAFRKPESSAIEKQQEQQKKSGVKIPSWIEKVENPGEQAPQKPFGQQNIQEDVRIEKAGQMQPGQNRQPSSDVDRSQYSQGDVDKLEQNAQQDYVDKASQTKSFDDLDKKEEEDEAAKIDALLGGGQSGGGETGGGEGK